MPALAPVQNMEDTFNPQAPQRAARESLLASRWTTEAQRAISGLLILTQLLDREVPEYDTLTRTLERDARQLRRSLDDLLQHEASGLHTPLLREAA